ncbi:MAG: ZIP family metal transporter [Pirellulaceae bacterium]
MTWLLVTYCVLIAAASMLGGWLPNFIKLGHRHTQMVLSLVSGVMLGVAMVHLLPHSIDLLRDARLTMMFALAGLLFMFFLIRMFHFHYHDGGNADAHDCDHHDHEHEIKRSDISWMGLAIGFAVHTIIDGIALAAAVGAGDPHTHMLAGLGVFLAILLHKPLDALTITSLMAVRGSTPRQRSAINVIFALMCPLGALAFYAGVATIGDEQDFVYGVALAIAAGVFLCISLSDLLPEVQFHSHDRLAMSCMLLLGVGIAISIEMLL